jgi:hypothetical protein
MRRHCPGIDYRAYYTYFASMRHSLNQTELDEIQRRIATRMGDTGTDQFMNATCIDFYATCMFLAGAFHSTDHGFCDAVVPKVQILCIWYLNCIQALTNHFNILMLASRSLCSTRMIRVHSHFLGFSKMQIKTVKSFASGKSLVQKD